jgi:hypothetical protein
MLKSHLRRFRLLAVPKGESSDSNGGASRPQKDLGRFVDGDVVVGLSLKTK